MNMLGSQNILETPKRHVLGEVTNSLYVSPTANLKLLTHVALHNAYQRKEKSLQILCDKFLELYPLYGNHLNNEIQLDVTAQTLGVEKRRIYDIINILEALQCATHCRKNTYIWHGGSKLNHFLVSLKSQGDMQETGYQFHKKKTFRTGPKRRSLGDLAQRFLMMFLEKPPNSLINLEMAVTILIHQGKNISMDGEGKISKSDGLLKSKVRRLYDIANVLSSIGLIEKVSNAVLKKPVFRYVGPKCLRTTPISSTLLTPDSINYRNPSKVYPTPTRSKRKLEFNSPAYQNTPMSFNTLTPPPQELTPPPVSRQKWDFILQVADIELVRLNNKVQ